MILSLEKWLILGDVHAPYHDQRAYDLMLKAARGFKPDGIMHLGDAFDMYAVSSYSKDPARAALLKDELVMARATVRALDKLGAKRKVMLGSNHGDRLERYLRDKAPALFGLVTEAELLELEPNGWEFYPYKDAVQIGKCWWTHDVGGGGKYTTARAIETFQHSVVIGHYHQMQYHVSGNATGEYMVGAQFGWLGDVERIDYLHKVKARRSWSLGFGVAHHDTKTGIWYIQPVPIINYTCHVNGKLYG